MVYNIVALQTEVGRVDTHIFWHAMGRNSKIRGLEKAIMGDLKTQVYPTAKTLVNKRPKSASREERGQRDLL